MWWMWEEGKARSRTIKLLTTICKIFALKLVRPEKTF